MPVKLSYLGDGGILVVSRGDVKGSEIKEVNDAIYESPEKTRSILYQICDFRSAEIVDISQEEVRQLAMQDKIAFAINPAMRIAIVVKTDLGYGLSRMWETLAHQSRLETMVFKDLKEAKRWIRESLSGKDKK